MQSITSSAELKHAIQMAETKQVYQLQQLKEQLRHASDSMKPFNVFRSTMNDMASSPNLLNTVVITALGLATGFLARKIVVGASGAILKKLVGSVLQLGVTNAVVKHPGGVKSFGQFIYRQIHRKKERNSENP